MEAKRKSMGKPMQTRSANSAMPMPSMFGSPSVGSGNSSGVHVSTRGKRKAISTSSEQPNTVASMFNVHAQDVVESSIAKILFSHAIPFPVERSPYFKQIFRDVAVLGTSFTPLEKINYALYSLTKNIPR